MTEFDCAKPKDTGKLLSIFSNSEFYDFRYEHLDLNDLERILEETQSCRRRLVVTDGVFSMDGDIAPLCKSFFDFDVHILKFKLNFDLTLR